MATCSLSNCTKFSFFPHDFRFLLKLSRVFHFRGNHTPYGCTSKSDGISIRSVTLDFLSSVHHKFYSMLELDWRLCKLRTGPGKPGNFAIIGKNQREPEIVNDLLIARKPKKNQIILIFDLDFDPKVKTESAKRGFYFSGVKIYNALPTHLETERFYLPFKQGLKEHFIDC